MNKADNYREPTSNDLTHENLKNLFIGEEGTKVVELNYRHLKPNFAALRPILLLPELKSGLLGADGNVMRNSNEEVVFEVILAGKHTDEYQLDIKAGQHVIVGPDMIKAVRHHPSTKATSPEGESMYAYIITSFSGIVAIVDYKKI
ncbi:hypothetical protein KAU11_10675 [Candidatus Babeliales bacterium]|nr:hypothetical protein [Candidatus Babeliales bacterium]